MRFAVGDDLNDFLFESHHNRIFENSEALHTSRYKYNALTPEISFLSFIYQKLNSKTHYVLPYDYPLWKYDGFLFRMKSVTYACEFFVYLLRNGLSYFFGKKENTFFSRDFWWSQFGNLPEIQVHKIYRYS